MAGAGENKTVKVAAGLDEASFAKARRMISELTAEVSKLVQATSRLNFGGGRVTGASPIAGAGSSNVTQAASRMAGAGGIGGATDGLTRAVTNSAALFKAAATGSKSSFKIMSEALRAHVSDSDREIKRLTQSLLGLEKSYDRLKSKQGRSGGSPLMDSAMSAVQGRYVETADALKSAQGTRQKLYAATHDLDEAGGSYQHNKPPGFFARNFGGGGGNGMVAGIAGAMGIPPWMVGAGGMAAAAAGGLALANKGIQGAITTNQANLNLAIDRPMFGLNAKAGLGQTFGGNAMAIRHGDMARVAAMMSMAGGGELRSVNDSEGLMQKRRDRDTSTKWGDRIITQGVVGGLYGTAMDRFGRSQAGREAKYLGVGNDTALGVTRERTYQEEQAQSAQRMQQAIEAKLQADPQFNDRINRFYGGAVGNMGLARAAGMSGGNDLIGRNVNGGASMTQASLLRARATASGYDVGEYVGSMQEMAGTAGRGFLSHGTSMLGMKAGGLHNAASLFGVGAQFGGGGARGGDAFMRQLQSKIGRGGLDVTAASSLFSAGAGAMTNGNFASAGGGAFMGTLADAAASGTTGGDMLGARQVTSGLGAMSNMMAGGIDPLQMALNSSAALKAAPSGGYSTHKGLMDMSPADVTQVLKTNQVSDSMRMRGISVSMVRSYVAAQDATTMGRYAPGMGTGTEMGAAAGRYQKAGGLGYLSGMSQGDRRMELKRLAEITHDTTDTSLEASRGQWLLRASMKGYLGSTKGKGARDSVSRNSATGKAAEAAGIQELVEGQKDAAATDLYKRTFEGAPAAEAESNLARVRAQRGVTGDAGAAIKGVAAALTDFVKALEGMNGTSGPKKAGPPRNSASR